MHSTRALSQGEAQTVCDGGKTLRIVPRNKIVRNRRIVHRKWVAVGVNPYEYAKVKG